MWDERLNSWVSGYNDEQNNLGGHLLDLESFSIIFEMLDIKCKKKKIKKKNAVIDWSELVSIILNFFMVHICTIGYLMDFENFLKKELDSNIYYVKFFMVYLL